MNDLVERFLAAAVQTKLYTHKSRLRFCLAQVFRGVEFQNKRMLDIGGGVGLCSFYAACKGAAEAVCLEPEAEGSTSGAISKFKSLQAFGLTDRVRLETTTFQRFTAAANVPFDIILLYNSINHLDEAACINLQVEVGAREIYSKLFSDFYRLLNPGGKLIICDCSRYNFFARLGMRNPFCRSIEWHKHQSPKVWAELGCEAGFCRPIIAWSCFNALGTLGKWVLGNGIAAYFLLSHFCLHMERH